MQITINTADLLGDETTIRDEVIAQVSSALTRSMKQQAQTALAEMLEQNLRSVVVQSVTDAVTISMDTKFTDVDSYGREGKEASIRERIADHVQAQCTFKSATYSSDLTPFSRVVKDVVEKEVAKFKAEFTSLINKQVIEQSLDMATKKLKEAVGIK